MCVFAFVWLVLGLGMSPAISLRCLFMELVRFRTCCIWGFGACDSLMHVLLVCFHICFCSSEMGKFVIHCSVQDCEPCPHIAALALCLHVLASLVAFLACHSFFACFSSDGIKLLCMTFKQMKHPCSGLVYMSVDRSLGLVTGFWPKLCCMIFLLFRLLLHK